MQNTDGGVLYSASDLVNFLECEHLISLDLANLKSPLPKTEDSEEAKLLKAKGLAHEARYLDQLKSRHTTIADLSAVAGGLQEKEQATLEAMRAGAEVIYQATLRDGSFLGYADFLQRVPRPSRLGAYSYEALDTKLARSTKAKFIVQLGLYSALVAKIQGLDPAMMQVVLGDLTLDGYRYADYARYLNALVRRFLDRVEGRDAVSTYPQPCERCETCRWRELCEARRLADDHLCQVANITRLQTDKLQAAGIATLAALANAAEDAKVAKMVPEIFARLRQQAALQFKARETGENQLELLPRDPQGLRGFARLPRPDAGDVFFDMEGDPLEAGGLEYLFGLYFFAGGTAQFKPVWAHTRADERRAFEAVMDFLTARLQAFPKAHIYHYAAYEPSALKKLMSLHGTREAEVDNLLRAGRLVDLYQVVREGVRVSEPRYSIKNIEHFYYGERAGEVKSAGASIVYYERWRETQDAKLLKEIEDYNRDDVVSTHALREWLLGLRPAGVPWAKEAAAGEKPPEVGELTEAEQRLLPYRAKLLDALPSDRATWGAQEQLRELTYQLLDFHRRAAKPQWWAMFARQEMTDEELLEDVECLAGLEIDPAGPPSPVKRSVRYTYLFPEQESKLKTGDQCLRVDTLDPINNLVVDDANRRVTFTMAAARGSLPSRLAIGRGGPVSTDALTKALFRFADSVIAGDGHYPAITALLNRELPRIGQLAPGAPVIEKGAESLPRTIEAIANLDRSYLFVQGPPGAGKTYTASHVIVALLERGLRVGVSSNSHKAINHLLHDIEKVAIENSITLRGAKKSNRDDDETLVGGDQITDVFEKEEIVRGGYQLVAGTAWLFADPALDQALDYLFVDEAGQVALANLVAMGTSARNIVLVGDQMQLGQPIQGVHPGRSGESVLDYLLNGLATIPPEQGIFLETTWRMHPDICRFISAAVYDGRLEPEPHCRVQRLVPGKDAHPLLQPTGIRYVPAVHDGCSQSSAEEAALVKDLVKSLLQQRYRDKHGEEHAIQLANILVVAPYNMQVNLLRRTLPAGARVGTVDKFQGQEAEVVIISMATSSGDYLPRFIEFLFSKNRLNVAISRAKCLAILIANPALTAIRCATPEQMALVNTLCWVAEVGGTTD